MYSRILLIAALTSVLCVQTTCVRAQSRSVTLSETALGQTAVAQSPAPMPPAQPSAPVDLNTALRQIALTDPNMVVIAVTSNLNGQQILQPAIPPANATLSTVALQYGMIDQEFGNVRAIAPATMTLMNSNPGTPDIYADLSTYQAFNLLMASLTDDQWSAILSENGLSLSDLNTEWQQKLIKQLIASDGKLVISPMYIPGDSYSPNDVIDETDQMSSCRLRIAATVSFSLPVKGQENSFYIGLRPTPDGASQKYQVQNWGDPAPTSHGIQMQATLPNSSKVSNLDYTSLKCRKVVSIGNVKTIDDLINAVNSGTGLEIYCDKRLASWQLTVVGAKQAEAGDLLKALALCLTGTYRSVGPAYVLTDDIVGICTRRLIWSEWDQDVQDQLSKPILEAQYYNFLHHPLKSLSSFGDPLWLTPDEAKVKNSQHDDPVDQITGFTTNIKVPYSTLSSAQQEALDNIAHQGQGIQVDDNFTPGEQVTVTPSLDVQLLVPGVDQPTELQVNGAGLDPHLLYSKPPPDGDESPPYVAPPSTGPLTSAARAVWNGLIAGKKIAALIHPRTVAAVDQDVAVAKKLGLSQLWLDVFSDGTNHISPSSPLLAEAVAKTARSSIRIYPVVSMLCWGANPPSSTVDLDVLQQDSGAATAWFNTVLAKSAPYYNLSNMWGDGAVVPNFPGKVVSVASREVQRELSTTVAQIASEKGIAGVILTDTAAPGYLTYQNDWQDITRFDFGYNTENRLAYLRRTHMDPIDIFPNAISQQNEQGTIPPNFNIWQQGETYEDAWTKYNQSCNVSLMTSLFQTIQGAHFPANMQLPVYVQERGYEGSYNYGDGPQPMPRNFVPWNGLMLTLPRLSLQEVGTIAPNIFKPMRYEDLYQLQHWDWVHNPGSNRWGPRGMDCVVLDLSDDPQGDDGKGDDPLSRLAAIVTAPDSPPSAPAATVPAPAATSSAGQPSSK